MRREPELDWHVVIGRLQSVDALSVLRMFLGMFARSIPLGCTCFEKSPFNAACANTSAAILSTDLISCADIAAAVVEVLQHE